MRLLCHVKSKTNRKKIKCLGKQELKTFLAYLDTLDQSNYTTLFDVTLYKFLLATGCRISEALALEWVDIDLNQGIVSINKTLNRYQELNSPKSNAGYRNIPIDQTTLLMLKQYKNRQQIEGWQLGRSETVVFSVFTEKYAYSGPLRQRLKRHFAAAGVPDVSFHGFRHTHTSLILYAGVTAKDAQYRLGHSNANITQNTYWHVDNDQIQKTAITYATAVNNL